MAGDLWVCVLSAVLLCLLVPATLTQPAIVWPTRRIGLIFILPYVYMQAQWQPPKTFTRIWKSEIILISQKKTNRGNLVGSKNEVNSTSLVKFKLRKLVLWTFTLLCWFLVPFPLRSIVADQVVLAHCCKDPIAISTHLVALALCLAADSATKETVNDTKAGDERMKPGQHKSCEDNDIDSISYDFIFQPRFSVRFRVPLITYPVIFKPEKHPFIPHSVKKRLADLPPQKFRRFVDNNLTQEERESLMRDERFRLLSFRDSWPHCNSSLAATSMAKAGFYHIAMNGFRDCVQCAFCPGLLHSWETYDDPITEHTDKFSTCPFVKGIYCGNLPYADPFEMSNGLNLFASRNEKLSRLCLSIIMDPFQTPTRFAHRSSRRESFPIDWRHADIKISALVDEGFFYSGSKYECYCCGFTLAVTHDISEEHARRSPDCLSLIQTKGKLFIEVTRSSIDLLNRSVTLIDRLCPFPSCHFAHFPDFASVGERVKSFKQYVPDDPAHRIEVHTAEKLSGAGFFCDDGDIRCFYCSSQLPGEQAASGIDHWQFHLLMSPECRFLVQLRGSSPTPISIVPVSNGTASGASGVVSPQSQHARGPKPAITRGEATKHT